MELTEEQRERMRKNRERALEIQRRRKLEQRQVDRRNNVNDGVVPRPVKRVKGSGGGGGESTKNNNNENNNNMVGEETVDLEEFEIGASDWVTKNEAKSKYCLPDGTLEVCSYVEKQNPRNKIWNTMKLYKRSEIRRRARERFGGKEGLIEERRRRQQRQFLKDMEDAKEMFKTKK